MSFSTTYSNLPDHFFKISQPGTFSAPKLLAFNEELARELELPFEGATPEDLALICSGQKALEGTSFLSMAYAGHQFGNFVPQLGDGRAMLLGEVLTSGGKCFDLQLKGAGPTYYSRNGDGFSALGPVIREYILSEAMNHLGVPTTRALAAVWTGDQVYRERAFPGGVFTRVASSHLRIGTFQFFAARGDHEALRVLLDYAVGRHYPHLKGEENLPLEFLKAVMDAQVKLVSHWMSLGFIHGVMNTDNMSISGETIDYGPCAFMDHFKADKVYSYIDQHGRYRYSNQDKILAWNLARLADCMIPLMGEETEASIDILNRELQTIGDKFLSAFSQLMARKFGVGAAESTGDEVSQLSSYFFQYLEKENLDFTLSFRNLSAFLKEDCGEQTFFPQTDEFQGFLTAWDRQRQGLDIQGSLEEMSGSNPVYIPRNHMVERAIQLAEDEDFSAFEEMNELFKNPFKQQKGYEAYEKAPEPAEEVLNTFCGT